MAAEGKAPGNIAEILARGLDLLGSGRDALQGGVIGRAAASPLVSKGLGAAEIIAHLGVLAGWVDNKTATNLQMAEAAVNYLGGKIDGKTTVGQFASAYTDRMVYEKLTELGVGNVGAKAASYAVSGFVGMIVGRLTGAMQEGVIGKDTTIGKALEELTKQKNEREFRKPSATANGLPPQAPSGRGATHGAS